MWEEQHVLNSSKIKELWGHKVPPVMWHEFDLFLLAVQHFINCKNIWSAENHESKYTGSCTHTVFWVREVIIIGVLLETPLEYYWRPHWRTIGDPIGVLLDTPLDDYWRPHWSTIGDPMDVSLKTQRLLLETPIFSSETPIFSMKTPDFYWRPQMFDADPQIIVGDPTFLLETPHFRWTSNIFMGDPQILVEDPHIFVGDPRYSLETPQIIMETLIFYWRPKILDGDHPVFMGDPIFSLETPYSRWRPSDFHWRPPDSLNRENMGFPLRIWESALKMWGLHWKSGGSPIVLQWWRFLLQTTVFPRSKSASGDCKNMTIVFFIFKWYCPVLFSSM